MKKELPNFTEGSLGYPMFRFAVPILGALILQTVYGIVDTFVISRYAGVAAISGISSGSQFMDSVTGIIAAFATAITVLVAQQKGAKNQEELGKLLSSCILFFAVLSIACTLLITLCTGKIVEFMRTPPEAYQEAFSYIQICGTGIVAIVAYNIIGAFFSGLGNSTAPLIAVIVSFVLNIVGDFFTIGHLGMGASGAAVTTVISQYISVGVTYALFRRSNPGMLPHIGKIRLYKNHMVEILKTGIPLMFNDFLLSFSFILLLMIVNSLGVEMSASIGIAEKMFTLVLIFPKACRKTLSVVVAQCMGAQKKERAVKAHDYAHSFRFLRWSCHRRCPLLLWPVSGRHFYKGYTAYQSGISVSEGVRGELYASGHEIRPHWLSSGLQEGEYCAGRWPDWFLSRKNSAGICFQQSCERLCIRHWYVYPSVCCCGNPSLFGVHSLGEGNRRTDPANRPGMRMSLSVDHAKKKVFL